MNFSSRDKAKLNRLSAVRDELHTQGTDTALGAVGTKNPPVDADKAIYRNSAAADVLVTSTWAQVKAFLKTYFDGLYAAVLGVNDNYVTDAEKAALHAAVTVSAPVSMVGQALSLVNDVAAAVTEIDTGALSVLDTTIPTSLTVSERLPNRNAIINGGMDIWQRGTATLTNPGDAVYFPDRFQNVRVTGDGTYDLLQSAETPAVGFPFQYSLKLDCTHVETAVAAGELSLLNYLMEGYDFKRFEGEAATLSFWVKAVKTGIYCVGFVNNALAKSYVHEFTINSSSTWEKKTITLTFNSGGTFLYTTGIGLRIYWAIMAGSTYQVATANKDIWQSGFFFATDAQVNGLDNVANNFWLTGVQLELGSVATPFEQRPYQQELALCQRYFRASAFYVPAIAVPQSQLISMRTIPTIAGGGVGYNSTGTTADTIVHGETTGAMATLTLTAEL